MNAARAALTAMSMSSLLPACTSAMVCSVLGLIVWKVLPDLLLCHSLLIKSYNGTEKKKKEIVNNNYNVLREVLSERFIVFADNGPRPHTLYLFDKRSVLRQHATTRSSQTYSTYSYYIYTHVCMYVTVCICTYGLACVFVYLELATGIWYHRLFLYATRFSKFIICLNVISEWLSIYWKI